LDNFFQQLSSSFSQMMGWELVAVILAIAYLLLIMRESIWGWPCALISTAIYTLLFWNVSLLMESALNIYYMGMAVYGWRQWRMGGENHQQLSIQEWPLRRHFLIASVLLVVTLVSGYILSQKTLAAWPYLDSFTTWASVLTTYMVAKKVLENWLYWILIDSISMVIYAERGLYLTALLFAGYLVICVFGYLNWRRLLVGESATKASTG
jgi:nicotinamide mononucleotide transporter